MTIGDLYSGLINPNLHNPEGKQGEFWGEYVGLNNLTIYSDVELLNIQTDELKSKMTNNEHYDEVLNFFNYMNTYGKNPEAESQKTEEHVTKHLYGKLIELLNIGLWGNPNNPARQQSNRDDIIKADAALTQIQKEQQLASSRIQKDLQAQTYVDQATILLNQLKVNEPLKINYLNSLKKQLGLAMNAEGITGTAASKTNYTQRKADLAEQLMYDAFMKANPRWTSLLTGSLLDSSGKQLIEDNMLINVNAEVTADMRGKLYFKVLPRGNQKDKIKNAKANPVNNIQEFLDQVQNLSTDVSISLSDELYDLLKKGSQINAQVKSGHWGSNGPQALFNYTKRNAIQLEKIWNYVTFTKLWELYELGPDIYFKTSGQRSEDLVALTNYALSQALGDATIPTVLDQNDIYFTEQGFFTAVEWMKKYKYLLKFAPGISSIDSDFLTASRQYALSKVRD